MVPAKREGARNALVSAQSAAPRFVLLAILAASAANIYALGTVSGYAKALGEALPRPLRSIDTFRPSGYGDGLHISKISSRSNAITYNLGRCARNAPRGGGSWMSPKSGEWVYRASRKGANHPASLSLDCTLYDFRRDRTAPE